MLTDAECRKAAPGEKDRKLADRNGLYLFVTTKGFKSWRWKYRFDGKERRLILGSYPDMKLGEAREVRDEADKLRKRGIDPAIDREQRAAAAQQERARTFESVVREWHTLQRPLWTERHAQTIMTNFEEWVFPEIGRKPIGAITSPMLLKVLREIEARPAVDTARRIRQRISSAFSYAIGMNYCAADPAATLKAIMAPLVKGHWAALTSIEDVRAFLKAAEALPAFPSTRLASRFLALTAVRSDIVRWATWDEIEDLDGPQPLWRIPAHRMKLVQRRKMAGDRFDFLVPLSKQAVDVLKAALKMYGPQPYIFPGSVDIERPNSENAISDLYKRLDDWRGRHVPHGWRSSFSTIMNERAQALQLAGDRPIIDLMLAHIPQDVEGIYNRAAYLPRRREIAQEWADILLAGAKQAASLIVGPRRS